MSRLPTCPSGSAGLLALALWFGASVPALAATPHTVAESADSSRAGACFRVIQPGTIVRFRTPPADHGGLVRTVALYRGEFVGATADSLWLLADPERPPVPIALADVQGLEVKAGRSHLGGALIGAGAGAACGFMAGLLLASVTADRNGSDSGLAAFVLSMGGVAIGLPAGAAIGGVRGIDRWERAH